MITSVDKVENEIDKFYLTQKKNNKSQRWKMGWKDEKIRIFQLQVGKNGENNKEVINEMNQKQSNKPTNQSPEPADLNGATNAHTVYENVPQILARHCDISEAQNPSEKIELQSHKIDCDTEWLHTSLYHEESGKQWIAAFKILKGNAVL